MGETPPTADDSSGSDGSTARLHLLLLRPALQAHAHSTQLKPFQVGVGDDFHVHDHLCCGGRQKLSNVAKLFLILKLLAAVNKE